MKKLFIVLKENFKNLKENAVLKQIYLESRKMKLTQKGFFLEIV